MKKNVLKRLLLTTLCITMFISLAACGSKDTASAKEPVPASKAFGTKGIWYEGLPSDKNISVEGILCFNGSGQVTYYQTSREDSYFKDDLTFADLNGKNSEEITKLAKEKDKAVFDSGKSYVLSAFQEGVSSLTKERDKLQSEYDSRNYDSASNYVFQSESDIPKWYERHIQIHNLGIDFYNLIIEKIKAIKYKEPKPVDFTLSATTDNTGNAISKESIKFDRNYYFRFITIDSAYDFSLHGNNNLPENVSSVDELIENYKDKYKEEYNMEFDWDDIAYSKLPYQNSIALELDQGPRIIYDMAFRGYTTLTTIVDQDHAGFTLDQTDTKGIEIDKK